MAALRLYARASVPVVASMSSPVSANSCSRSFGCWNVGVKTSDVTVKSEHFPSSMSLTSYRPVTADIDSK